MTPQELGQKYKAQFPQYANLDDTLVGQRVLSVHPEYKSLIQPSDGGRSNPLYETQPGFKADVDQKPLDTDPTGQRILENAGRAGAGYGTGQLIGMGVKGAMALPKTTLGKAVFNSPKAIGKQYQFQDAAAGITDEGNLPTRAGRVPGFEKASSDLADEETVRNMALNPPVSYPKDNASFIKFARMRMAAFGDKLTPDEITAYKKGLGGLLNLGKDRLEATAGEGAHALASVAKEQATSLQNTIVDKALTSAPTGLPDYGPSLVDVGPPKLPEGYEPTRSSLNKVYGLSKTLHPDIGGMVSTLIKKIGYLPVKIALGEAGAKGIIDLFKSTP